MIEVNRNFPFHNLEASMVLDGKVVVENIAVKNVWHKGVNVLFDVYVYTQDRSIILDSLFIRQIEDLSAGKKYPLVKGFIQDFLDFKYDKKSSFKVQEKEDDEKLFDDWKNEIAILVFIAKYDSGLTDVKIGVIGDYLRSVNQEFKKMSDDFLRDYILNLDVLEKDFYDALAVLDSKNSKEALKIFTEAVKVSASDGYIDYDERRYIAEVGQKLRELDVSLNGCVV